MINTLFFLAVIVAPLSDPAQEARAERLDAEIRCVACENEPISQSTADIANDMRAMVRERIAAGDSDQQVRQFFARRYGDFVLLRPPINGETTLLWGAPALLLASGVWLVWRWRRQAEDVGELTPEQDDEI
jgi:cytochrome c-type biogenesis protein CcmH